MDFAFSKLVLSIDFDYHHHFMNRIVVHEQKNNL